MTRRDRLTCYLVEREGRWEGLCMDYNLAVQGRSPNDARNKLSLAVRRHLSDLMDAPARDRGRPAAQRAPWRVRMVLALRAAWPNRAQGFSVWAISV